MLPQPAPSYDVQNEAETRTEIERELQSKFARGQDVELANNERLILVSPNGTRYQITVDNTGTLSAVAV